MNKQRDPCWICANRWNCPATNKGRGPCKDFRKENSNDVRDKDRNCKDV